MARIEMHLTDGRVIDLSEMTPEEAVAYVRALGITDDMIRETRHYVSLPSITCPRCGWRSFNPNDIRERYCGHCHAFHETMPEATRDA